MTPLPLDCEAYYRPGFLAPGESTALFAELAGRYDITNKVIRMADGTEHAAETAAYMFADPELTSFDVLPEAWGGRSPWPGSLAQVRERVAAETGTRFQVARCVFYRDGSEAMGFHSDPPAYGPTCPIASLSLGAERELVFRPLASGGKSFSLILENGSLLLMGKHCQDRYEHGIPACPSITEPRINLTFRLFGWV